RCSLPTVRSPSQCSPRRLVTRSPGHRLSGARGHLLFSLSAPLSMATASRKRGAQALLDDTAPLPADTHNYAQTLMTVDGHILGEGESNDAAMRVFVDAPSPTQTDLEPELEPGLEAELDEQQAYLELCGDVPAGV